MLQHLLFV